MASKGELESWIEEVICPICLDFFTHPVSVECGHNFCRSCITQYWEGEGRNSCPQCREKFVDGTLRVNRGFANLAEKARKLNLDPAERKRKPQCDEHQEELKLFCETDRKLICVTCAGERKHRDHRFLLIPEAVEICKEQVKSSLESIMENILLIEAIEQQQKQKISTIQEESHSLETQITSQIADLHQILTDKEQELLQSLREEEGRILNPMQENLQKIQENLNSLQEEFSKLQERMNQNDSVIFLKEEAHQKRRVNEKVKTLSVTDIAQPFKKFDHPFWLNAALGGKLDGVKRVPLTLDVATVRQGLEVCKGRKRLRRIETPLNVPKSGTRLTAWECTLGLEGFTSGRHYWEVQLSGNRVWCLGVTTESVKKKGWDPLIPEAGVWSIGQWIDGFYVNTFPPSRFPDGPILGTVGVYLSYESGTVSFYNADTKSHLHTFTGNKFKGKLYPLFGTWDENKWLGICSGPT